MDCNLDKVYMENNNIFECLLIKLGSIKDLDWTDENYISNLMKLNLFESVDTNSSNFIEVIATKLEMSKYNKENLNLKTEIFGEEPYYLYEMIYVDLEKETEFHTIENELGSLININGDKIYSNVLLFKNYLPSMTDSMVLTSITKTDLERVLLDRVHTKVVLYNYDEWIEQKVVGNMELFANNFFENEKYYKKELPFLMHNINIWYSISEYGNDNVCGNLINERIEKCIIFTMKSDEYRGNITLDEVLKIIKLSTILTDYITPSEFLNDKNDEYGRKIIYNKYKVLDYIYNKNI
jgi:hypothetical protein